MKSKLAGLYFKILDRDNGKTSKRELHMICILLMMELEVHDGAHGTFGTLPLLCLLCGYMCNSAYGLLFGLLINLIEANQNSTNI
jgi:hypothetical protein